MELLQVGKKRNTDIGDRIDANVSSAKWNYLPKKCDLFLSK